MTWYEWLILGIILGAGLFFLVTLWFLSRIEIWK